MARCRCGCCPSRAGGASSPGDETPVPGIRARRCVIGGEAGSAHRPSSPSASPGGGERASSTWSRATTRRLSSRRAGSRSRALRPASSCGEAQAPERRICCMRRARRPPGRGAGWPMCRSGSTRGGRPKRWPASTPSISSAWTTCTTSPPGRSGRKRCSRSTSACTRRGAGCSSRRGAAPPGWGSRCRTSPRASPRISSFDCTRPATASVAKSCACMPGSAAWISAPRSPTSSCAAIPRDLHALIDLVERLDEAALAAQRALTLPFVREVMEREHPAPRPRP